MEDLTDKVRTAAESHFYDDIFRKGIVGINYAGSKDSFIEWYTRQARKCNEATEHTVNEQEIDALTKPKSYSTEIKEMTNEEAIKLLTEIGQKDINMNEKSKQYAIIKAIEALSKEVIEQRIIEMQINGGLDDD